MINRLIYKFKKIMIDSSSIYHKEKSLKKFLDDISTYSIEEKIVGYTNDGRPIYRIEVFITALSGQLALGTLNIDYLMRFDCLFKVILSNGQKQWRSLPWAYAGGSTYGNAEYVGGVTLVTEPTCYLLFQCGDAFVKNFEKGHIILEYTKNTD